MNHSNMYAVGLALCTFANISSEEMSRDLSNEIEKLLGSSNTYIRKKVSYRWRIPFELELTSRPLYALYESSDVFLTSWTTSPRKRNHYSKSTITVSYLLVSR
jgi:hypothetical protein